MIKKNKKSKLPIFLLLLGISSGFAYLTSNLSIFGGSLLKGQKWDVHFQNVQVSSDGVQIEKPQIIDKTTVEYNITLDKPGDFVEFTVDAKNDGTIDAMISTIPEIKMFDEESSVALDTIPDYLDYRVFYADYDDIDIKKNHLLEVGQTITYKVYIEYKKDITNDQLLISPKKLKAEFNVEYVQADNNAIPYNYHEVTESTLSKSKFKSFGKNSNPKQVVFLTTGVSDSANDKYVDISEEQDKSILAWMDEDTMNVSAKESKLYIKAPTDSSYLLGDSDYSYNWIRNIEKIDVSKLDTSDVTNMQKMFYLTGIASTTFKINGLSNWDTSNVTDMSYMFSYLGDNVPIFELDLSGWNVDNVMYYSAFNSSVKDKVISPIWVLDEPMIDFPIEEEGEW